MFLTRLTAAAALGIAGCGGAAAQAAPGTPAGHIAFRRYLDAAQTQGAVFVVNPDGTGERQLTQPPAGVVDDQPDWSQDGTRIVFERCKHEGPCTVMTVPSQGGAPTAIKPRCIKGLVCEPATPAFGPGGLLIFNLFEGREKKLGGDVWIERSSVVAVDPQTGAQRTIVSRDHWQGDTHDPAVSADGKTLVYQRWNSPRTKHGNGQALYAVDIDGTHERRLTPWNLEAGDHPVFSPDGNKVLFRSYKESAGSHQSDFWTVHPDASGLRQLTRFKAGTTVLSASYSPDGEWIVHATNGVGGNADLFIMRADGTDPRPLTRTKLWDSAPDWGP